jgi:hypothetical protein
MDKPVKDAVDQLGEATHKITSNTLQGLIKIGSDALAAIPGVGAVIEMGKIANDATTAAGNIVKAGNEATQVVTKVTDGIKKNIDDGVKQLAENKTAANQIMNRTEKSINTFENPINNLSEMKQSNVLNGGNLNGGKRRKTRRLFKRKNQSKRIRFSI